MPSDTKESESSYFLNDVLGAYLKKRFQDVKEAMEWAESVGINSVTMRDVYYKNGRCGREVFNQIITNILNITPDKAASIIDSVRNLEPISESQKIWNSIQASEPIKRRLALEAKASAEIEAILKGDENAKIEVEVKKL